MERLHIIREKLCNCKLLVAVCLGQLLSLLICGTAVTSGVLGEKGIHIPTAQSFLNYFLLCSVYTTFLVYQNGIKITEIFKLRGWKYFLLAAVDVEANYLVVKAYHYTTVTSVQLLDSFIIPTVLILSWIFLRVRYKILHFIGIGVCLLGVVALVLADYFTSRYDDEAKNKLLGDFMVLGGSVLYGISNVGQEYVVRNFNRVEYLGMIGFFGSFINGLQFAILERKEVAAVNFSSYETVLALVGFALCLFLLYSLMPVVIGKTSATSVNLNLLSADFYALIVGIFLFHYQFHMLYFVSFACIIVGLVLYSIRPPPSVTPPEHYVVISSKNSSERNSQNSNENALTPTTDSQTVRIDMQDECAPSPETEMIDTDNSRHINTIEIENTVLEESDCTVKSGENDKYISENTNLLRQNSHTSIKSKNDTKFTNVTNS